jgi:hypothetical protein
VLARKVRKSPPLARSQSHFKAGSCSPPPMRAKPGRGAAELSAAFPVRKYFHFASSKDGDEDSAIDSRTKRNSGVASMRAVSTMAGEVTRLPETDANQRASELGEKARPRAQAAP